MDKNLVAALIRSDIVIPAGILARLDNYIELNADSDEDFDELYMLMAHERNYGTEQAAALTSFAAEPATDDVRELYEQIKLFRGAA